MSSKSVKKNGVKKSAKVTVKPTLKPAVKAVAPDAVLCNVPGCKLPARAKGQCSKHYQAARRKDIALGRKSVGRGPGRPKGSKNATTFLGKRAGWSVDQLFSVACATKKVNPQIALESLKREFVIETFGLPA